LNPSRFSGANSAKATYTNSSVLKLPHMPEIGMLLVSVAHIAGFILHRIENPEAGPLGWKS